MRCLLDAKADPKLRAGPVRNGAVHIGSWFNNLEALKALFEAVPDIDVRTPNAAQLQCLSMATCPLTGAHMDLEVVQLLCKQRADAGSRSGLMAPPPLYCALQNPNATPEIIDTLIAHGAPADTPLKLSTAFQALVTLHRFGLSSHEARYWEALDGASPLQIALWFGHLACAARLVEHGALKDHVSARGLSPWDALTWHTKGPAAEEAWAFVMGEDVAAGKQVSTKVNQRRLVGWGATDDPARWSEGRGGRKDADDAVEVVDDASETSQDSFDIARLPFLEL